ncbi:MAG: hypothetical protein JY451_13450 [Erythrobacter sp.]|nr:MAG: hypothetical protein JY451_13450 [Erythrobacter sp.]
MKAALPLALAALALTSCASRIELPGSVLAPVEAQVAVEDMGPPEDWRAVDGTTGQIADVPGLEQLATDFPDSASVRLRLLNGQLAAEDLPGAFDEVQWLTGRGYAFSPGAEGQLVTMFAGAQADELGDRFASDPAPLAASTNAATIPAVIRLPEAAFYDTQQRRMFATSIVSRGLFVQEQGGEWQQVPLAETGSLAGIALDAPRGLIWVGSGVVEATPDPASAFRGVIAIDRITLEERRRVPAPDGVTISDIAVGPDGSVYGSDPLGGGVYIAAPTDAQMQTFIAPGTFRSPQGIAVRPDNTALYVSDYRYGLAQVMLRSRHAYRMRAAQPMLLDGVDGLWLLGNRLIAVQNGVNPHRITAFTLGEGIGVIASAVVLERANPAWTEPLGGAISGGVLYYVGTGQWHLYGQGGALAEEAEPRPSNIHALQLVETPAQTQ